MCGIVGYSGKVDQANLFNALAAVSHRGPDDSGTYFDKEKDIGLGHSRLSIIDLSMHGHQPMLSADGNVILVFNGEIYNFRDLRRELEAKGYGFNGKSDTEVLLMLYLECGIKALDRLNGIFALAVWDKRNQTLLVARDGFGVKPLYYTSGTAGFHFASELKALFSLLPSISNCHYLDRISLHRYLSFLYCPGDGTPLANVKKLQPGEALLVKDGCIQKKWNWYHLPTFRLERSIKTSIDAIDGTVKYLKQAVNRQMVADVPVGAFLSGGLDSSSIVVFAREKNPEIRCFSIDIVGAQETGTTNDLPYARTVAKHIGVSLDVIKVHSDDMAADLQYMVAQLDEPLADPACLNVLYISRLARKKGIKVLLSGVGGDDLFTGYRRHMALNYEYLWNWLPLRLKRKLSSLSSNFDQRNYLKRRLRKYLSGAELNDDDRIANYFLWSRRIDLERLYTLDFRAEIAQQSAIAPMLEYLSSMESSQSSIDKMLALEQRFFLADHNLNYTDKMSMAAGVEVRVPFLDNDLVEFASRIPARMKQRGRQGKWVLKKAMEPYLPKDIIYRPKTGFGAPLRRWIKNDLNDLVSDLLSVESIQNRGLFVPNAVQKLIHDNRVGAVDASYTIFSLMSIEIWCREYIDKSH